MTFTERLNKKIEENRFNKIQEKLDKKEENYMKTLEEAYKNVEHIYNGPALLDLVMDLYEEAYEEDENVNPYQLEEEAQEHAQEINPYKYKSLNELDRYGYANALKILRDSLGARVWAHVDPSDYGAVHNAVTSVELSYNFGYLFMLAEDLTI